MNDKNWEVLTNRIILLNLKWKYWQQLFGTKETVDLLNNNAPSCFALIQESMLLDVLASIARLFDPPQNRAQQNLVLESLLEDLDAAQKPARRADLATLKDSAEPVITVRHKIIAHEDQGVASGLVNLTHTDNAMITRLINKINSLMSQLERDAGRHPHVFAAPDLFGDGDTLAWLIDHARTELVRAESGPPGTQSSVPGRTPLMRAYVRYSV